MQRQLGKKTKIVESIFVSTPQWIDVFTFVFELGNFVFRFTKRNNILLSRTVESIKYVLTCLIY